MPTSQILLATTVSGDQPLVPFNLTLDASDNSRNGDSTSVQSTWWGTQSYDAGFVTNIGQQSYTGFYAFTAGKAATLTATCSGASGFGNGRGRSITATFSIAVGDRIVFFAGKPSTGTVNNEGGGGGASCLLKYGSSLYSDPDYENGFVPLIIAAGGGGIGVNYAASNGEIAVAAPPLTVTTSYTSTQIMALRDAFYPNANLVAKGGGASRGSASPSIAQSGGCGWKSGSRNQYTGNIDSFNSNSSVGIAYGALGNYRVNSTGKDGGFGGGGSDYDGNSYGCGGGGYYGGSENTGANSVNNDASGNPAYTAYSYYISTGSNNILEGDGRHGALSFVHSDGTNVTDNGLYGTGTYLATADSAQNKGRVYLAFS